MKEVILYDPAGLDKDQYLTELWEEEKNQSYGTCSTAKKNFKKKFHAKVM